MKTAMIIACSLLASTAVWAQDNAANANANGQPPANSRNAMDKYGKDKKKSENKAADQQQGSQAQHPQGSSDPAHK